MPSCPRQGCHELAGPYLVSDLSTQECSEAQKSIRFGRTEIMMLKRCSIIALLGALYSTTSGPTANAQTSPFSIEAKQKAEALLKQMTLVEKVGQLNESSGRVMPWIAIEK